ncbi:MAG: hypothetical protein KAT70_06460 [Thermoplasmata archaeon]|nr:hypothetical protein [Thermoplasmata archaeon]
MTVNARTTGGAGGGGAAAAGLGAFRGVRGFSATSYLERAAGSALEGNAATGFEVLAAFVTDRLYLGPSQTLVSQRGTYQSTGYRLALGGLSPYLGVSDGAGNDYGLTTAVWDLDGGGRFIGVISIGTDTTDRIATLWGVEMARYTQSTAGYTPTPSVPVRIGRVAGTPVAEEANQTTLIALAFKTDGLFTQAQRMAKIRELLTTGDFGDSDVQHRFSFAGVSLGALSSGISDEIGSLDLSLVGTGLVGVDDIGVVPAALATPDPANVLSRSGTGLLNMGAQDLAVVGPTLASSPRVACDSSAAAVGVTCPSYPNNGTEFTVLDVGNNAATNNITITRAGTQLINGANTYVINTNRGVVTLYFDGTNWLAY